MPTTNGMIYLTSRFGVVDATHRFSGEQGRLEICENEQNHQYSLIFQKESCKPLLIPLSRLEEFDIVYDLAQSQPKCTAHISDETNEHNQAALRHAHGYLPQPAKNP